MYFSKTIFPAAALFSVLFASPALAQEPIRVAVAVSEGTGGLVASAFRAALRSLGDVVVVSPSEAHDYYLAVNVVCSPEDDCTRPSQYAIAAWLYEPLTAQQFVDVLAAPPLSVYLPATPEQIQYLQSFLTGAMRIRDGWTLVSGVQRYEQTVRNLVARWDSRCFEHHRRVRRLLRQPATIPFTQEDFDFLRAAACGTW